MKKQTILLEPGSGHRASVIWLHGLGADGSDFVSLAQELRLPVRLGVRFVFPHAPVRPVTINGGMEMHAWYDVRGMDISDEEDEEGFRASAAQINALIERELQDGLPASRIVLAGFSQGGALSLYAGLRCVHQLAGLLVLSAYLPLRERLTAEARRENRQTPILMLHGTWDPVIPHFLAKRSCARLQELGYSVQWRDYPMAHMLCPQQVMDIRDWLVEVLSAAVTGAEQ